MTLLRVQSTRLFPKRHGAGSYRLTGIAKRCDWVVLSDPIDGPEAVALKRQVNGPPRSIYLSLRAPFRAFDFFFDAVLPRLTSPVVLVSGSEDITVPNQQDRRWRAFSEEERARLLALTGDPRIAHWFIENRDEALENTSSLPLGYVFTGDEADLIEVPPVTEPLASRPLRVLCSHRIRQGAQWARREQVTRMARQDWPTFVDVVDEELPLERYEALTRGYPFVLCVEGGGLDPAPKAWLSLVQGAIPIIRRTTLADAYGELPVAFVEDWTPECLTPARLRAWRETLAPEYDDPVRRAAVLEKLSLDFWWGRIAARLPAVHSN